MAAIKRALANMRRAFSAPPSKASIAAAKRHGFNDASNGLTVNDYPFAYADGELREAWLEGWRNYHVISDQDAD